MIARISGSMVRSIALVFCIFLTACAGSNQHNPSTTEYHANYAERTDVQQFIHEMCVKYDFDQRQLLQLFSQVKTEQKILNTMSIPSEGLPWYRYRAMFLTTARAQQGATYWHQHEAAFAAAEKRYGVDTPTMLAILGVETNYGRTQGTYPVINALATLGFNYPPRYKYFRSELVQFLLLTRDTPLDPLTVRGSYAGAIGAPQFMPTSYRQYGVDVGRKGYCDLINNSDDIIFSVANYFKAHGWQAGQPVAVRALVVGNGYQNLAFVHQKSAKFTLAQLQHYGIYPASSAFKNKNMPAEVLCLAGENGAEFWLVFHNFDVIMKYNTSPRYAMAVYQLSDWIRRLH